MIFNRFAANSFLVLVIAMLSGCGGSENAKYPASATNADSTAAYSTFTDFNSLISATNAKYPKAVRITEGGTPDNPEYHGFFFYNCAPKDLLQFDPSGRYMAAMRVKIEGREVLPDDTATIGIIDLENKNQWTTVGYTTAWNWQQGCRLEWIPQSHTEIIWDDRAEDGKSFVSRIYNTETKKTRKLPRPVYTVSPDGRTALTHEFERMEHGGTNFVGISDKYKSQWAPAETGIFRMDMQTGKAVQIVSVRQMATLLYPRGLPSDTLNGRLYIFREGYNPSGNRFIAFVKDVRIKSPGDTSVRTTGFSMTPEGQDIRYLFEEPSHHYWSSDSTITDNVREKKADGSRGERAYFEYADNNTGKPINKLWSAPNGHDSYHPGGDWILTDTYSTDDDYPLNGYEYLYLYHIPSKKFVALGKFPFKIGGKFSDQDPGIFRVDLHPRFSPDGRKVSFDATYDGIGRQIYLLDVGFIIDNPPVKN